MAEEKILAEHDEDFDREEFTKTEAQKKSETDPLDNYEFLSQYTTPVKRMERKIVGREAEMRSVLAAFERPELCNVILLGDAGSGKTALVQGLMERDFERRYLEVNMSKMIADTGENPNKMAEMLKELFNEASVYGKEEEQEVVLFMDEFHQVVQLSAAAVEVLKPLLADSGTRGIRILAATTYIEFQEFIAPNQPLVERLMRINLRPPTKDMVVSILKGMAERYEVIDNITDESVYDLIFDYSERYIPANSQPRKSLLLFDAMVGWHRAEKRKIDAKLLADVLYDTEGVNVAFRVDASKIKSELDKHVLSQDYATTAIEKRLQVCIADLNDKTKPMSSLLFTGSTGTGKGTTVDTMIPVWTEDASVAWKRAGDIKVGDFVFSRDGSPEPVVGVFPQGMKDLYEVEFSDGRSLTVDGSHLWAVYPNRQSREQGLTVYSTETLVAKGVQSKMRNGRIGCKYKIPMNEAVQWPEQDLPFDPYALGVLLGNGCMTCGPITVSGADEYTVDRVAKALGPNVEPVRCHESNYSWTFRYTDKSFGSMAKHAYAKDHGIPEELIDKKSYEKTIPEQYMHASIEQRYELLRGLLDTDGSIGVHDGDRFNINFSTTSEIMAGQVRMLCLSLGIGASVRSYDRDCDKRPIFEMHLSLRNDRKKDVFALPRKRDIALQAENVARYRDRDYECIGLRSIEKLPEQGETVCLYVGHDEHLYQAGEFVVTHNTEITKQLARILFHDPRNLIRFDMTEYANPDSLDRFRNELAARVWERPFSIVLLDEIEKACSPVTRVLLSVLDDGRLTDRHGREVSFLNCYIIMTTNAGSELYKTIAQYNSSDTGAGELFAELEVTIRRSLQALGESKFPPELIGRIDAIVPFQPLSENTMRSIAEMKLQDLRDQIASSHGIKLKISQKVIDYLVFDQMTTDSDAGGARDVVSKLEREVTTAVARYVNENPTVKTVGVTVKGEMAADDKTRLKSNAHIFVAPTK